MKPNTIGVYQLFERQGRHVVPLYQRPYVWDREEHWEPLWDDIRDRAEAVLVAARNRDAQRRVYPHFLGAIVTNQVPVFGREVHAYEVIDGQQRLTTLQLFLAAFRDVVAGTDEALHRDLGELTRNSKTVAHEDERYKVWPTNSDRRAFMAVLDAGSPSRVQDFIHMELTAFRQRPALADAYLTFHELIADWIQDQSENNGLTEYSPSERIDALFDTTKRLLHVVEIGLEDGDDPQVIFETLNARGAPLLPSDLVRNYVFTQANRRGEDADALYKAYWHYFEDIDAEPFWKSLVRVGREQRQMIVLFLYHFLTATTAEELSASHLFIAFKRWWESKAGPRTVEEGLGTLRMYADAYRKIVEPDPNTRFGVFAKRLQVLDVSTLNPVLLHLLVDRKLDNSSLGEIVLDLESFLVRRTVCRLPSKNLNRYFLGLLQALKSKPDEPAQNLIQSYLLAGKGESVLWPGDSLFKNAWLHSPAYRKVRPRGVSMILEAIDRHLRTGYQEGVQLAKPPTVEHVMPQAWRNQWPAPPPTDGDEAPEVRRDRLIHTFGNLTLITGPLNSKLGDAPYPHRREEIIEHTELRLNTYFHKVEDWNDAEILKRGEALFADAVQVWRRPGVEPDIASEDLSNFDEVPEPTLEGRDLIAAVVEEFSQDVPEAARVVGKAKLMRQVKVKDWPNFLHYEFNFEKGNLLVGLHLEARVDNPIHSSITFALHRLVPTLQEAFPGYKVAVEERTENWRWIALPFSPDIPVSIVAQAMRRLIELTRTELDAVLGPANDG